MKRIVYAGLATISGLVLLFGYRTSHGEMIAAQPQATGTGTTTSSGGSGSGASGSTGNSSSGSDATSGGSSSSGSSDASDGSSSSSGSSSSALKDGTFTGSAVDTRYGPVQVQITISGGRITQVNVPEYPSESPRDQQINSQAVPMLVSETTSAQSASISMISGATYTSQGYTQSLQSALDQAQS
ncbi:FMN-binding protein [Microbacterium sp. NPDC057650]|uniref:FMN-binding protein n=1 Tax=unclassified Microbacterium TaxID=2609290 RepID=UPI0036700713